MARETAAGRGDRHGLLIGAPDRVNRRGGIAMHEIVELIGALARPVTVLIIVFVLRPELLRLVGTR